MLDSFLFCGIDGQGDDRSGLGVDNFLRFIQQLRVYLTQAEQEKIWAKEAQRPSSVGNYLLVYALIARGFAQKQPAAIVAASARLQQLQKHQDVSLERSICALLLGQTEQAITILEKMGENLAFMKGYTDPVSVAVKGWINSPGHQKSSSYSFTEIFSR